MPRPGRPPERRRTVREATKYPGRGGYGFRAYCNRCPSWAGEFRYAYAIARADAKAHDCEEPEMFERPTETSTIVESDAGKFSYVILRTPDDRFRADIVTSGGETSGWGTAIVYRYDLSASETGWVFVASHGWTEIRFVEDRADLRQWVELQLRTLSENRPRRAS